MQPEIRHKWASGAHTGKVSADDAAEEFGRIRLKHGSLTPSVIVEESRDESAVLHSAFEWDDSVAAEEYRKGQARSLVRAVITVNQKTETTFRSFTLVKAESDARYEPTETVVVNPDMLASALANLKSHLHSARESVDEIIALASALNTPMPRKRQIERASAALNKAEEVVAAL